MSDIISARALLEAHGFKVVSPAPPRPPRTCMVCKHTEYSYDVEWMIDVRVVIARGEEGHADIAQYVCEDDLPQMQTALTSLGFKDHRHGGINFLEDMECPGAMKMSSCPTPEVDGE